ncbi:MAG: pyrroline-5-carboxylate reductase [Acidimicrobiales bacterium]|nr:pyrroline-5-carboxylate reductase [Acidimicrobiales bacterium]MCB9392639.1 pyrroline-5-carboxylate reductase [Acidimicrobiaceae bacterium]
MRRLAMVGGGNMGAALLGGMLAARWAEPDELAVVEVLAPRRDELAARFPGVLVTDTMPAAEAAVIAVKPYDVAGATAAAVAAGARRVLSIAAGVATASIEAAAGDDAVAVVRAMPNTPALVGAGAAAIAGGVAATDDDLAWAESILGAVGTVVRVPEHHLDAVTGLAGSGPAYLFLVAEALIDAGVLAGLARPVADALVRQLFVGSAALLADQGDPARLRAMVTSPGGTTAAGLRELELHGVRAAFLDAVTAATSRSRELA